MPHPRSTSFTGREDVLTLLQTALASGTPAALTQPQAIIGLGGIGKTQTAVEYAYRHRDDYQAVFWVSAADETTLCEGFVEAARLLGLPQALEADQSLAVAAVKAWLEREAGWLLILDNADDLSVAKPFLPLQKKGHVLLTTRAFATGTFARKVEIRKLSADDGALLLLRRAKLVAGDAALDTAKPADQEAALTLSREMDGLPLALDQAGAFIEETPSSPAAYLTLFRSEGAALLAEYGAPEDREHASVRVTYSLAFAKVAEASPAAGELVRCCAFLAPDAILEEIFTQGDPAGSDGPSPFGIQGLAWEKIVGEACRYSLLSRDADARTLSIHRLVQTVIQHEMEESQRNVYWERLIQAVGHAYPGQDFTYWPLLDRLLPHQRICAEQIERYGIASAEAARLLSQAGLYLNERAQYRDVEPLYVLALSICEKTQGPEQPLTATSLNNLAILYYRQGNYAQALPLLHRALSIREQSLGPTHRDTAQSLNNLAELYQSQDKHAEALPLFERALSIREKALGPTHPDTAISLNNLAGLYYTQGNYAQALPLFHRALSIREKALGPEHPSTANSLVSLALLYKSQGKYADAEPLYMRALTMKEKALGLEHPNTATSLNNLALLYKTQGNYTQAEPLLKQALDIFEKALGPEHPTTKLVRKNYAILLEITRKIESGGEA